MKAELHRKLGIINCQAGDLIAAKKNCSLPKPLIRLIL